MSKVVDVEKKRVEEKKTITFMIKLYCKGNHHTKDKSLCEDCQKLLDYSLMRIDKCRNMETKTFCAFCKTKCYKPQMSEELSKVMRYAGPRMIFYHPKKAISHALLMVKEKKRIKRENSND